MRRPPQTRTLSFCICTRDRPAELARVLLSIAGGSSLPETVFVSDDSEDATAVRVICAQYDFVRYSSGPHRGISANRNAVVILADTDYVCLIDDDGIVSRDYVAQLRSLLPTLDGRTIITGDVLEYGGRSTPKNPSFWGHFVLVPNGSYQTINLNSVCFPRRAFSEAFFDESLIYGYEDMDLCASLLRRGYRIRHEPHLLNEHDPPQRTPTVDRFRERHIHQARFRTSMKRYVVWERKPHLAVLYFFLAPLHRLVHDLRVRDFVDIFRIPTDIISASIHAIRARVEYRRTVPGT